MTDREPTLFWPFATMIPSIPAAYLFAQAWANNGFGADLNAVIVVAIFLIAASSWRDYFSDLINYRLRVENDILRGMLEDIGEDDEDAASSLPTIPHHGPINEPRHSDS